MGCPGGMSTISYTRIYTERVPPRHPIILLKSNKFNMAAVSVKRSIDNIGDKTSIRPIWSVIILVIRLSGVE